MKNVYFPNEEISPDDVFFVCSMIERVARRIKQPNKYVVNAMGYEELCRQLSVAQVSHSENPEAVAERWEEEYNLRRGNFDITHVDATLCPNIPTTYDMGKVYMRLIMQTRLDEEDYAQGILRVYNHDICQTIDNYNASAHYEPSYFIARSYFAGGFA